MPRYALPFANTDLSNEALKREIHSLAAQIEGVAKQFHSPMGGGSPREDLAHQTQRMRGVLQMVVLRRELLRLRRCYAQARFTQKYGMNLTRSRAQSIFMRAQLRRVDAGVSLLSNRRIARMATDLFPSRPQRFQEGCVFRMEFWFWKVAVGVCDGIDRLYFLLQTLEK